MIELIYDRDCPNVPAARQALREACRQAGIEPAWREWERSAPDTPDYARSYGSPTVLIEGHDAAGPGSTGDAQSCRVYRDREGRLQGVPPAALLAAALTATAGARATGWLATAGAALAGAATLLPALSCPACWPAYAALLSALGLGFVDYTPYVGPALGLLVTASLASLALDARRNRDLRPLLLGGIGAVLVLTGRLTGAGGALVGSGIGALVAASLGTLLRRSRWARRCGHGACPPAALLAALLAAAPARAHEPLFMMSHRPAPLQGDVSVLSPQDSLPYP